MILEFLMNSSPVPPAYRLAGSLGKRRGEEVEFLWLIPRSVYPGQEIKSIFFTDTSML